MRKERRKEGDLQQMKRRDFLQGALTAAATVALAGQNPARSFAVDPSRIAFNTANLVARVTNYRYQLAQWMEQHKKTIAATDAPAWRAICDEIARAGFKAVEIWEAHASPVALNESKAMEWKQILKSAGLKPIAYAGSLRRETLQICQWLEIPHIDGGLGNVTPDQATALCKEFGIAFNIENHPEKSAAEILKKIGGGNEWLGVCIDTGWLGTQGVSAPDIINSCGLLVRHTHIKDVKGAELHETCPLGEGVVRVADCLKALQQLEYKGCYSWEDEPEDRNPFDSASRNREWLQEHLA